MTSLRAAPRNEDGWADYVDETQREIAARLHLEPGMAVLDAGCGTGALLRRLAAAEPALRLTGIDLSPATLRIARFETPAPVGLLAGVAEALPFADASFDAVISTNLFHYVGDPLHVFAELKRVVRPDGEIAIVDWCDNLAACAVCEKLLPVLRAVEITPYALSGGGRVERIWSRMTA